MFFSPRLALCNFLAGVRMLHGSKQIGWHVANLHFSSARWQFCAHILISASAIPFVCWLSSDFDWLYHHNHLTFWYSDPALTCISMFVLKFPADPQVCLHFRQVRHVHTSTHLNTTIHPSIQYIYIYIYIDIDIHIDIYMYMHIHMHIICPKKFVNSSWLIMVNSNFSHDISPHFFILPAASSPAALWALPAP